jgi:tetratricopeptide (TPR) repeat protein
MKGYFYLLLFGFTTACTGKTAADYLNEADAAAMISDYTTAIHLFEKAINKDPQLKEAYFKKAFSYENMKQDDAAITAYKALLAIDTANTRALFSAGLCYYRMKQFAEAISFYNKALQTTGIVQPADTMNRKQTIDINTQKQPNGFGVPVYEIYYSRGMAYYANQQYRLGFFDFETCIQLNYLTGDCNYRVGLCLVGSNQTTKACEAFRIAAQVYGSNEARKQLLQSCR